LTSALVKKVISPNGGPVVERERLSRRFAGRVSVNENYSRKMISYQGNRESPGLRWMKYKEGFSSHLVSELIEQIKPKTVLDPFAGLGTTPGTFYMFSSPTLI